MKSLMVFAAIWFFSLNSNNQMPDSLSPCQKPGRHSLKPIPGNSNSIFIKKDALETRTYHTQLIAHFNRVMVKEIKNFRQNKNDAITNM